MLRKEVGIPQAVVYTWLCVEVKILHICTHKLCDDAKE